MRDLTEQLSTNIAKAINEFRTAVEDAQQKLTQDVQAIHQTFDVASSLRVEAAHKAMASQIKDFLGVPPELPKVADGPYPDPPQVSHTEDYSKAAE